MRVITYMHILQGLHLRCGWFPPAIPNVKTQIFHLLLHTLRFLAFNAVMLLLTDSEKLLYEEDVIFLGISTQAHVIRVCLHLSRMGNQFLYKGSASQDI